MKTPMSTTARAMAAAVRPIRRMGSRLWAESKFSSMGVEYYANAVFLPIQKRNGVAIGRGTDMQSAFIHSTDCQSLVASG